MARFLAPVHRLEQAASSARTSSGVSTSGGSRRFGLARGCRSVAVPRRSCHRWFAWFCTVTVRLERDTTTSGREHQSSRRLSAVRLMQTRTGIVVALVLGVVTTIAVAWSSVWLAWPNGGHQRFGWRREGPYLVIFRLFASMPCTTVEWSITEDIESPGYPERRDQLPHWSNAWRTLAADPRVPLHALKQRWFCEICFGLPFRALAVDHLRDGEPRGQRRWTRVSGIPIDDAPISGFGYLRTLPTRVLPLGFAIDTALFASTWWLLLFAFPTTRRLLRHRRGACLRCGYGPLGGHGCPECGAGRDTLPVDRERT